MNAYVCLLLTLCATPSWQDAKVAVTESKPKDVQTIVQNQTDYIKKIVAHEKEKNKPRQEIDADEYMECKHLQLLFKRNRTSDHFYITQRPSTTESTDDDQYFLTHTPNPKAGVKYVQYEPAILQRVVMDDGRIAFYRYGNQAVSQLPTSTQEPTTTTTEASPNYEIDYGTAQRRPYVNTMKFVIPVSYAATPNAVETAKSQPWYFVSPYQYYNAPVQRSSASMPMPYVPVYSMIRTLTIPDVDTKK